MNDIIRILCVQSKTSPERRMSLTKMENANRKVRITKGLMGPSPYRPRKVQSRTQGIPIKPIIKIPGQSLRSVPCENRSIPSLVSVRFGTVLSPSQIPGIQYFFKDLSTKITLLRQGDFDLRKRPIRNSGAFFYSKSSQRACGRSLAPW